jgi:hypothetical protein
VPMSHENLKPWESAFLGEKPLLTTSVFWQCTTGALFTLTQIYFSGVQLRTREPEIYSRWWPLFAVLVFTLFCLSWIFLAKASRMRALLRKNKGQPEYEDCLVSAKSLALTYFILTMGFGLALSIARLIFR